MDEYSILKKKQKKNAFAATALLISIAIALLVMVGAVLILSKVNDNDHITSSDNSTGTETETQTGNSSDETCEGLVKEIVFNDNIKNIKEAAISYFTNERLPHTVGETVKITLKQMKDKKLVLNILDSQAKSCDDSKSYVEVTKEENEYTMKIFLSCSNMEDYIIVHLGCYDYCDKNICEKKEETPKDYEYEYKKVTSCVMGDWSNWGEWKLTREKTSDLKKEDTKVETTTKEVNDTIDATKKVTYNCDKYPGYKLVENKCVKETTVTDTVDASYTGYSYSCEKYQGYKLDGKKCVKEYTKKDEIDATQNPITYTCPDGYKLNGKKCEKTVTKTDTVDGTYVCPEGYKLDGKKCKKTTTTTDTIAATITCPSGYKLDGKKCKKTVTTTDTIDATITCPSGYKLDGKKCKKTVTTTDKIKAEAVYGTRVENYKCYKEECTTKIVFKCPTGKPCGNYPETSCETVEKTCQRQVQYITGYKCKDGYKLGEDENGKKICTKKITTTQEKDPTYSCPSGYKLDGKKCKKTTTTTQEKDPTYSCPSGYSLSGTKCKKKTTTTDEKDATFTCPDGYKINKNKCTKKYKEVVYTDPTENPATYTCPDGYKLDGKKCIKYIKVRDEKDPDKVPGGYVCPDGYTLSGKTCTKKTTVTETHDASGKVTYTCPSGYNKNNTKCTRTGTQVINTTYYRYATRSCTGGNTSIKWSDSSNDKSLLNDGYKLTGNKREIIVK